MTKEMKERIEKLGWQELKAQRAKDGKERHIYLRKGYRILAAEADYMHGGYDIRVREEIPEAPDMPDPYLPPIIIDDSIDNPLQEIRIMTTSYGGMDPQEIGLMIGGYQKALTVAAEIKTAFPECFE